MAVDVTKFVKQAADAAKLVPENLQAAAFNKVFDALLASSESLLGPVPVTPRSTAPSRSATEAAGGSVGGSLESRLDRLDRTKHAEINHSSGALENSLRLLRAVRNDLEIDGLSAATIAKQLTNKFRCRYSRQAVSQALNDAGRFVNRHKEGKAVVFRIMGPGEAFLDDPSAARLTARPAGKPHIAAQGKQEPKAKPEKSIDLRKVAAASKKPTTRAASSSRVGGMAALTQLYDAGFLKSPRTISDMVKHLKEQLGRAYKANELSPPLLRYLRNHKLTRSKNAENQYEYKQA